MKNTFKVFGIIGLMLVIGFSISACGGGDDDNGGGGGGSGGGGSGGGISGGTVTYDTGIADADKPTDFSRFTFDGGGSRSYPLSDCINAPASVTISGDKLTIKLGTPKDEFSKNFDLLIENGVNVNPKDAKGLVVLGFLTSDLKYGLCCRKDGSSIDGANDANMALLTYVDRDVTIKGTYEHDYIYDVSLMKGWNYWIVSDDKVTDTIRSNFEF